MLIERHVYGSYSGYTTLGKSPGVSADDCRQIETAVYGFGQTYDPRFYASLKTSPAFFTLAMQGGRRSLTIVREGKADDNGRPTLRFITAILTRRDWDAVLMGDIGQLVKQDGLWRWDGSRDLAVMEVADIRPRLRVSESRVEPILRVLSMVERSMATHQAIVVSESAIGPEEMRVLEILYPPRVRPLITSACRALSPNCGASVVSLAGEGTGVTCNAADGNIPLSPYALALEQAGIRTGMIPLASVVQCERFGLPDMPAPLPVTPSIAEPALAPCKPRRTVLTATLCAIAGLTAGFVLGYLFSREPSTPTAIPATAPATQPLVRVLPSSTQSATTHPVDATWEQEQADLRAISERIRKSAQKPATRSAATKPTTRPATQPTTGGIEQ